MTKWATIDKAKLEAEIDKLSVQIGSFKSVKTNDGNMRVSEADAPQVARLLAQHDALITVFNCLATP